MATADPLDPRVAAWWAAKADEIYAAIPDFGGFVIKADSENEPGPYKYGRDHADGANMIAAALAPHGGTAIWRAFVYTEKGDRVTDAYRNFIPLAGKFAPTTYLQVKNGPLDFQIREPVSPLFGCHAAYQSDPRVRNLTRVHGTGSAYLFSGTGVEGSPSILTRMQKETVRQFRILFLIVSIPINEAALPESCHEHRL